MQFILFRSSQIIALLSLFVFHSTTALVRRFLYDAELINELRDAPIQFSRSDKLDWIDLNSLAEKNHLVDQSLICTIGDGTWIGYPEANYSMGNSSSFLLIVGEACITTDNVKSIQPLGSIRDPFVDGVILFPKEYYEGKGELLTPTNPAFTGEFGSIIYVGDTTWNIDKEVCIFPVYGDTSICLIPDIGTATGAKAGSKTISAGCEGEDVRIINVQSCYGPGVHYINLSAGLNHKALIEACEDKSEESKGMYGPILNIWNLRLTDMEEMMDSGVSNNFPEDQLKMVDLLHKIVEIYLQLCDDISPRYISIIESIFLTHLKFAWGNMKEKSVAIIGENDYLHAVMFIDTCYESAHNNPLMPEEPVKLCSNALPIPDDPHNPKSALLWDLFLDNNYDVVIEHLWYIFNAVIPSCNVFNDFRNNDWFITEMILKNAFFKPIGAQWKNPGRWQRLYPFMFNGFDMPTQRLKILNCVNHALGNTPLYDPYGRMPYFPPKKEENEDKGEKPKP